jgi:hypothetical protein
MDIRELEAHMQVVMRRVFFEQMEARMASAPHETADWLIRLHGELAERFAAVLPSKASEIRDHMDNVLFSQQLRAGTYGSAELGPLIQYTWALLRTACAPDMDEKVQTSYNEGALTTALVR